MHAILLNVVESIGQVILEFQTFLLSVSTVTVCTGVYTPMTFFPLLECIHLKFGSPLLVGIVCTSCLLVSPVNILFIKILFFKPFALQRHVGKSYGGVF